MSIRMDTPAQYIKGVGPQRAQMLAKAGIETAEINMTSRSESRWRSEERIVLSVRLDELFALGHAID